MTFRIIARDAASKARVGVLRTKSGEIETPFFMPVATKTAAKHISSEDLASMHAQAIICNAYVLSLRPGAEVIANAGGIARFMSYKGIVFTDSGGFQMYSPQLYLGSMEEGVSFRNPYTGERVVITPEQDMELQLALQSDVAMCLDSMPLIEESRSAVEEAVRKTTLWAGRCKKQHDAQQAALLGEQRQLLFGIIQGGIHAGLREHAVRALLPLDFDGYAIGGLALGEPKEEEYAMIDAVKKLLPEEKPCYLMGAGHPLELLEAIARGCDLFDSRFPTQNARHGTLFSSKGYVRILNAKHAQELAPIDAACACFVCRSYTRVYVRHLLSHNEGVGLRLASYHNLFYLQQLMQHACSAIRAGTFMQLKDEIAKVYGS